MFPTQEAARKWLEGIVWPNARTCPCGGCADTRKASATSPLLYYFRECQKPFSVKIGTALQKSNLPLRKWVFAICLEMTNPKGVSSMKLHRDVSVPQKAAFTESVEIDETFFGGKRGKISNPLTPPSPSAINPKPNTES
ncbi:MAG: hypothetical protein OXC68_13955 [Aestuariivita sp.]|nr:hypothetical protein [Aestuariivita sp.]